MVLGERGIGKNKRASLGRRENLGSGGRAGRGSISPHWIAWELHGADPILQLFPWWWPCWLGRKPRHLSNSR